MGKFIYIRTFIVAWEGRPYGASLPSRAALRGLREHEVLCLVDRSCSSSKLSVPQMTALMVINSISCN